MNKNGPILIVDDDVDDQFFLEEAFKNIACSKQVHFFSDGQQAFDFLIQTEEIPSLIISDINMPLMDGFALREKLNADAPPCIRCIPFVLFSTSASSKIAQRTYDLTGQGLFIKPTNLYELESTISTIIKYWDLCDTPNSFT